MKKQELQNWRDKSIADIQLEIKALSVKLAGAYLAKSAGKLKNTAMIKNLRRDIAWLQTVVGEKQKLTASTSES